MKVISSKDNLPSALHNLYIDKGYRVNHTYQDALFSLFSFHNESLNIWSHLTGFICVVVIGIDFMLEYLELNHLSGYELLVLEIYLICASCCLFFSTLYHLFRCVSESCHHNLLRLDLTGVGFLVAGSFLPSVYFGFHCYPELRDKYFVLNAMILFGGIMVPWIEYKINGYYLRPYFLLLLVISFSVPYYHWAVITPSMYKEKLVTEMIGTWIFYAIGFIVFITRFPERNFPKSFLATQIFSSHAIWHICVFLAIITWYFHIIEYAHLMKSFGCHPYN